MLKSARWVVGCGENICIQNDIWLASGNRIDQPISSELKCVKDLMEPSNRCWDIAKVRNYFSSETAIHIFQTPIAWNVGNDSLRWPHSKSGEFSVKSSYYCIHKEKNVPAQGPSSS